MTVETKPARIKAPAVDFDTQAKKAAKGSVGQRNGQVTIRAEKLWDHAQAKSRGGLGWRSPMQAKISKEKISGESHDAK